MNFRDINYEVIEEKNLERMKIKSKKPPVSCHHSFRVERVIETTGYGYYVSRCFGIIHLRCEHCGLKKKLSANKPTIFFYNKGNLWSGKRGK